MAKPTASNGPAARPFPSRLLSIMIATSGTAASLCEYLPADPLLFRLLFCTATARLSNRGLVADT